MVPRLAAAVAALGSFVPVHGHAMYYECSGSGSPTVVLDAGSPEGTPAWRLVQPAVARFTRVCSYDRAGIERSAPAAGGGARTALTQVGDLHALLHAARIRGPYVLVGHSWGGLLVQVYAHRYPREAAGLVLLDATSFPYGVPPRKRNRERIDVRAAAAELAAVRSLGSRPLVVLGSTGTATDGRFLAAQDAQAALSTDSVSAIARHSTHEIPRDAPGLVVSAVRAVVGAVRGGRRLPPCRRVFPAAGATCR